MKNELLNLYNKLYFIDNKFHTERFILSNNCNLRCKYCFETVKEHMLLQDDIIEKRIELLKLRSNDVDEMIVDLFGGEPLLNWNGFTMITEAFKDNKKVNLSTITNGTLLNEERIRYLSELERFKLDLSIDGNLLSNSYRKDLAGQEVFSIVLDRILLLKKYDINFLIKMTIGKFNVEHLYDSLNMFKSMGIKNIYMQCIDYPETFRISPEQMEEVINITNKLKDENFDISINNGFYSKKDEFSNNVRKIDTLKQWNITLPNGTCYSYIQGGAVGVPDYEQFYVKYENDLSDTNLLDVLDLNTLQYRKLHDKTEVAFYKNNIIESVKCKCKEEQ